MSNKPLQPISSKTIQELVNASAIDLYSSNYAIAFIDGGIAQSAAIRGGCFIGCNGKYAVIEVMLDDSIITIDRLCGDAWLAYKWLKKHEIELAKLRVIHVLKNTRSAFVTVELYEPDLNISATSLETLRKIKRWVEV